MKRPDELRSEARELIEKASDAKALEELRLKFLGRKGELTEVLKSLGKFAAEERKEIGKTANEAKKEIELFLESKKAELEKKALSLRLSAEKLDVTEPGKDIPAGARHMIWRAIEEISEIFMDMGYSIIEGPEVDTVFYNFDALNTAPNHPSRDLTDTFYIDDNILLRTQTSPNQVRTLERLAPPFKAIVPGRCFRVDSPDATHSPMFYQIEGIIVDEGVGLTDLKGTLDTFAKKMFGESVRTNFRPHFFPFTEPSAEMDVSCFKCGGEGCNICGGSGWIEILGSGMVHPNVLKVGGIDTDRYTGFAFGMGVERIAMLKYGIDDIRLFYENDVRFIEQFY
jgi:phenylalanyl-tRNA synthetase alpha chain